MLNTVFYLEKIYDIEEMLETLPNYIFDSFFLVNYYYLKNLS